MLDSIYRMTLIYYKIVWKSRFWQEIEILPYDTGVFVDVITERY